MYKIDRRGEGGERDPKGVKELYTRMDPKILLDDIKFSRLFPQQFSVL